MADYKKLALQGAVVGIVASFFLGRGRKGFEKAAKYGALGAAAAIGGSFVLNEGTHLLGGHVTGADEPWLQYGDINRQHRGASSWRT